MFAFLDNWENSSCWDVQPPDSEADGKTITSEVPPIARPADPTERLAGGQVPPAADQAPAAKTAVEEAMVAGMLSVFSRANCNGLVEAHSGCNWAEAKG